MKKSWPCYLRSSLYLGIKWFVNENLAEKPERGSSLKIAIAGASGFVGQLLIASLKAKHFIIALGRSIPTHSSDLDGSVEWRTCDLFSLLQTEKALEGADIAIYLVHSMLPTARLMQSTFENADLLLADNFARAARKVNLRRIIYLGGLIPDHGELSRHLASRLEVQAALKSQGTPVTALRAGLILGAHGSSFEMLFILVKRLPIMICPRWTRSLTQCIDVRDVICLISFCIENPDITQGEFDIGGPDVQTYQQLMSIMAEVIGVRRRFFFVPYFTPGLSRLWVQLITGASKNLVSPLIQSLRHEMVVKNFKLLQLYGKPLIDLKSSLRDCLKEIKPSLRQTVSKRIGLLSRTNTVRSIQRLPLPKGRDAVWIGGEYFRWLPHFFHPFIRVERLNGTRWDFRLLGIPKALLILEFSEQRSVRDRQLYYIKGGMLVQKDQPINSRLEFHETLKGECIIAAIHDFKPSLPWVLYKWTQALIHLWVMKRFGKHLESLEEITLEGLNSDL